MVVILTPIVLMVVGIPGFTWQSLGARLSVSNPFNKNASELGTLRAVNDSRQALRGWMSGRYPGWFDTVSLKDRQRK